MEEKVSLKRNEIFIAHNKCVYAGGEVSENNVRVLGSLEDKVQNTKKTLWIFLFVLILHLILIILVLQLEKHLLINVSK